MSFVSFIRIIFHIYLLVKAGSLSTKIPTVEGPEGEQLYNFFSKPSQIMQNRFRTYKKCNNLKVCCELKAHANGNQGFFPKSINFPFLFLRFAR